jgi:hypothetical protein
VFTNIHPAKVRVWNVGEDFSSLAGRMAKGAGLEKFAAQGGTSGIARALRVFGAPIPDRSAYDRFMLRFHDYLKEDAGYQAGSPKTRLEFPPMATWLVYTDTRSNRHSSFRARAWLRRRRRRLAFSRRFADGRWRRSVTKISGRLEDPNRVPHIGRQDSSVPFELEFHVRPGSKHSTLFLSRLCVYQALFLLQFEPMPGWTSRVIQSRFRATWGLSKLRRKR